MEHRETSGSTTIEVVENKEGRKDRAKRQLDFTPENPKKRKTPPKKSKDAAKSKKISKPSEKVPKLAEKVPQVPPVDKYQIGYQKSPKKKEFLNTLAEEIKKKNVRIENLEKELAETKKQLHEQIAVAAEGRGELRVMKELIKYKDGEIEYLRGKK